MYYSRQEPGSFTLGGSDSMFFMSGLLHSLVLVAVTSENSPLTNKISSAWSLWVCVDPHHVHRIPQTVQKKSILTSICPEVPRELFPPCAPRDTVLTLQSR